MFDTAFSKIRFHVSYGMYISVKYYNNEGF